MFKKDGITIVQNFLSEKTVKDINSDLDLIFSKYSINGSLYCNKLFSGWNNCLLECTVPGYCSVNIFEIAIDVAWQFEKHYEDFVSEDYILTALKIFSEKDNPTNLFWHTDNRKGMLRAMIYLKGGDNNSGKFLYSKGSHNRDYHVEHKLSPEQVQQLQHTFTEATAPIGSLIIFDSYGFHSKKKCPEERRILFLEFNTSENVKNYKELGLEAMLLPSNHLTPKVISNINLFVNNNVIFKDNPTPLPLKPSLLEIKKSASHSIRKIIWKTWRNIPFLKKFTPFKLK